MIVYQVWIVSDSCDIMVEEWGDEVFLQEKDAEDYILHQGLLDRGYSDVYVRPLTVHESSFKK